MRDGGPDGRHSGQGRRAARRLGRVAEWIARVWLAVRGYHVLEHNLPGGRGTGAGEIDIVARRGRLVIFVEVKARDTLSRAADAITAPQQVRVARAAGAYLASHPALAGCDVRFDALLVAPWRWPRHIADAWRPEGR
ncbi:MAG: YraN family protein [Telmatospirillum sp.]|nr:YraN family protein [Telmatospirillum sp.]